MSLPIIDSHIHLYAASHIGRLNWTADLPSDHALNRQNSLEEYRAGTASAKTLRGFVFLETDRKSGLQDHMWEDALEEVNFLTRIAEGKPVAGEGHTLEDKDLVLGIVPWAPIPAGPVVLARYMSEVRRRAGDTFGKIKGVRYLLQDKPTGTMLSQNFVESLQLLDESDLSFDLGVDARSGGVHQLQEACEMLDRVYAGGSNLRVIINHMCKPDLRLTAEEIAGGHPHFVEWKKCVTKMAGHKNTYMKLSGMFSELPAQDSNQPAEIADLVERTGPWVDTIFELFGPSRIMFGSDWPVCNVGGPAEKSWSHYTQLVEATLKSRKLSQEEQVHIWSATAASAYRLMI